MNDGCVEHLAKIAVDREIMMLSSDKARYRDKRANGAQMVCLQIREPSVALQGMAGWIQD